MASKKKVFLALGCGCLVPLLCLVAAIIIVLYLSTDKDSDAKYEVYRLKGVEFGKNTDQEGCMEEGLAHATPGGISNISAGAYNSGFVKGCLSSSRPTPNFCAGTVRVMSLNHQAWVGEQCRLHNLDTVTSSCPLVYNEKVAVCYPPNGF